MQNFKNHLQIICIFNIFGKKYVILETSGQKCIIYEALEQKNPILTSNTLFNFSIK